MRANLQAFVTQRSVQLTILLFCFYSIQCLQAERVALFYNSDYVQISEGNLFAEGSNMLATLDALGHEVNPFSSLDATDWTTILNQNDLLIIPELEIKNLNEDLPSETKILLHNYIKNGGGLIICGVVAPNPSNSGNALRLLNGVFDFDLQSGAIALSGQSSMNQNQILNTFYKDCDASVENNNSISFITGGLPVGSKRIYSDQIETNNTTVALVPFTNGKIAYLGWGWWNAAPLGDQDNGWLSILEASIKEVACKAPQAKAVNSFTLELSGEETVLDAQLLDENSVSCSELNFSVSPNTFTCEDVGTHTVLFEVTDGIGRTASTTIDLEIIDPNFVCLAVQTASITGKISTIDGDNIQAANIELLGAISTTVQTSETGNYQFQNLNLNQAYEIAPSKNDNPLNGVSSYDLILMGLHILEINPLQNPYQLIAADVDNNGYISTADIVELRKMILYQQTDFSNNESWKFVRKTYVFENPSNPFQELLPSTSYVSALSSNTQFDFVGIKIGDLNGSATVNDMQQTDERNHQDVLHLDATQQSNTTNFKLKEAKELMGFQLTLALENTNLEIQKIESDLFSPSEIHTNVDATNGLIHISCTASNAKKINKETTLFSIHYEHNTSPLFTLHPRFLQAEAYNNQQEVLNLQLSNSTNESLAENQASANLEVFENYPNPFETQTTIRFQLEQTETVQVMIFNVAGQQVYDYEGNFEAGQNEIILNADELAGSGSFIYVLKTPSKTQSMRLIKL